MEKQERNSNFEILRIIAMLLIIAHHFSVHGYFDYSQIGFLNRFWLNLLANGGKIGVNIFVMISGYFLVKSEKFKLSKLLQVWLQTFIYSLVIFLVFMIFGSNKLDLMNIIRLLTPISSGIWWFVSTYVLMFLFYPFINKLIYSMSKKTHQWLLFIMALLYLILPTFSISYGFNNLIWFIFLYLLAGYIRIYDFKVKLKPFVMLIMFCVLYALLTLLNCYLKIASTSIVTDWFITLTNIGSIDNALGFVLTLLLFFAFKEIKPHYSKLINILGAGIFGVYLIHDHNNTRHWLWVNIFKNATYQTTTLIIPYSIFAILMVFVCSIIISIIYNYTIGKLTKILTQKIEEKVRKTINEHNNGK